MQGKNGDMAYLKKYISKYWKKLGICLCFLMLEALCDLSQPALMSRIVDTGIRNRDMAFVLHMGLMMLGVTGLGAVGALVRNFLSSTVSQRFGGDLRADLYRKIQSLSYEVSARFDTASLVTRLTNDVNQLQNFANGMMRIFIKAPILCIGSIIMATLLDPQAALVLVVVVPCVVLIVVLGMRKGYPLFARVQAAVDGLNGSMRTYLGGVRVVKAFHRLDFENERFTRQNDGLCQAQARAMRTMAMFGPSVMMVVNLGIVAVLYLGGLRINAGSLEVGKVIAFINYMTQISFSLMAIFMVFTMFVRARASAERIGDVMNAEDTMPEPERFQPLKKEAQVRFSQVSFSYHVGGEPVLHDLSFSCKAGQTVGIIGSTGAGKSSLVNLIPRFYDPAAGTVEVFGTDVRQADSAELRRRIAVVPQKTTLFSGTILENLQWGDAHADRGKIEAASACAQAHDFITACPEGYETRLGQGGVNLSGGQKQRLAIARALVRRPDILILDDCTSAVDAVTEQKIRAGLRAYSQSLLCILIAQRITSVKDADMILVLDNGRIVGSGTHAALLQNCAAYRDIYASQFGKETV